MARRLFVALAPGPAVRQALAGLAEGLRLALGPAAARLRFTDPATFHLTVRFLGAVPETAVPAVISAVAAAAAAGRPLALAGAGLGAFPAPVRPRAVVLLLGGEVAPLQALAASLEAGLAAAGLPPEPRPLRPHVTLARARERRGAPDLSGLLPAAAASASALRWRAGTLTLFESHLGGGGARHEPLLAAPLGARRT